MRTFQVSWERTVHCWTTIEAENEDAIHALIDKNELDHEEEDYEIGDVDIIEEK